ncbi:hypothetical protein Tco_0622557 [Tanacetum coccineum]
MAPRGRPTRLNPDATPTPVTDTHTTTSVTNAQIQAMINEGVTAALAARDATRPRPAQTARECSYSEFLKCKPLDFKGTEGVVGLTRWFEKMESTTTPEVSHVIPWAALKKMMTDKYCPRGEIKKIETEMWNLKVKGTDVVAYNQRFIEGFSKIAKPMTKLTQKKVKFELTHEGENKETRLNFGLMKDMPTFYPNSCIRHTYFIFL